MSFILNFADKAKKDIDYFKKAGDKVALNKMLTLFEGAFGTSFYRNW